MGFSLRELFLGFRRMDKQDVGLAALPHGHRLAGPHCYGLDPVAGFLLKYRDQDIEQAGVLRAGGGREDDILLFCSCETGGQQLAMITNADIILPIYPPSNFGKIMRAFIAN
jgi:hypothetical protein